ncbi:cell division protein FtsQ/DivIB [Prochlorococcus sp. MIT 1300]|uniref:cell division protein FtsQ/DivIB n=1 Tax=Prochlorococcus sp. MIT 1300 TaxID=3096218 RepID=UPI002A74C208|nr:FtsQ-type POTRA domain-containing protein [Prochlorococcus sp. MIT 1300]
MKHLRIKGNSKLDPQSIINASGSTFPQPLLLINPKELERTLLIMLPVKAVSIRKQLIPPRLEIELQERKSIAYATRKSSQGPYENGVLDKDGQWMSMKIAKLGDPPTTQIIVEGWTKNDQKRISIILRERRKIGNDLEKIILSPTGELSLKTKEFKLIQLGSDKSQLIKQLQAFTELKRTLPKRLRNKNDSSIDLRDPLKPELQIP